jgi:hypothetical protein
LASVTEYIGQAPEGNEIPPAQAGLALDLIDLHNGKAAMSTRFRTTKVM